MLITSMSMPRRGRLASRAQRQWGAKPLLQESPRQISQKERPLADWEPTERVTRWLFGVILPLGLLVRLLHLWAISEAAYPRIRGALPVSDTYAHSRGARTILAGDWRGREICHPYFEWMKGIAPAETWYRWWGGKEIFQPGPLYPSFLAGRLALCESSVTWVLLVSSSPGPCSPWSCIGLQHTSSRGMWVSLQQCGRPSITCCPNPADRPDMIGRNAPDLATIRQILGGHGQSGER